MHTCRRFVVAIAAVLGLLVAASTGADPRAPVFPRPMIELTVGNDMNDAQGAAFRELGVTSVESYVTWQSVEDEGAGRWNWDHWDNQVAVLKKHHIRWVPFLIAGPAYATPKWLREGPEHLGATCLEHGIASRVESIWNPALAEQVDRFLGEFAKRYRDADVIESLLLGISGDYGEAIFPVWGGGWTFSVPGQYHTHAGYWCGDARARSAFRSQMLAAYGSVGAINQAWGTSLASPDAIEMPPLQDIEAPAADRATRAGKFVITTAADRRRWLDFVGWYRESMTSWADLWLTLARKHFPDTEIYLCTGGDAVAPHGSDFAAQCRVAAKHHAGVRITNEASDYATNFYLTRWVASAGKFYGAYYGFEPAGDVNELGNVVRIYNVAGSGAAQLHCYVPNIFQGQGPVADQRRRTFSAHLKYLKPDRPRVALAVWYPKTALALNQTHDTRDSEWHTFPARVVALRDLVDFDLVDEAMSRDGALKQYPVLAVIGGRYIEKLDLDRLRSWVEGGGTLMATDFGGVETVEGDADAWRQLLNEDGGEKPVGAGRTLYVRDSRSAGAEMGRALSDALVRDGAVVPDAAADGVYATVFADRVLYLNTTESEKHIAIRLPTGATLPATIPASTIHEVRLP